MPTFSKIKPIKIQPRRLSPREIGIFVVCATVILIYIGYNFVFRSIRGHLESIQDKIKVSEKRLKNSLNVIRKEKAIEKEYAKYLSQFKQATSDEQEMASILSEIESVANDIGLHVSDMKPKKVRRIEFYNQFSATLTIEGDLATILHFLYTLQYTPHLFKVDELYLERGVIRTAQVKSRLILSKVLIP